MPNGVHSKKNEILKQTGVYAFSTQLTQVITLLAAIASRRFLGPTQTGVWATLQILVDYSKYTVMGVLDAASREIPLRLGRGDSKAAEEVKNLAFSFVTATSIVIASGIMLTAFCLRGIVRPEVVSGLYLVAIVIFLQRINNLLVSLLRAYKKFNVESVFMVASAVVNAILVAILTYHFKIYGFIWALILSFCFNVGFLLSRYGYGFQWLLNFKKLKPLLEYGLPLMGIGILAGVIKSIDKIMIARMLGFESLGLYSIALMACSYIANFSISVAIVLVPHFQERYGRRENPRDLGPHLLKAAKAYALTLPAMIGLAWICAPLAVTLVLPKFSPGIPAMKILTLSLFFIALLQPFHDYLITIKKHNVLFPILALTAVTAMGADWWVIRAGGGIEGVAWVTTAVFFLNFSLVYFRAAFFFLEGFACVKPFLKLVFVFAYFGGILGVLQNSLVNRLGHPFHTFMISLAVFMIAYLPLFWMLNQEFHLGVILRECWAKFKKKSQ